MHFFGEGETIDLKLSSLILKIYRYRGWICCQTMNDKMERKVIKVQF